MSTFTELTSRVAPLLVNDIDTDQIIPARFLKATDKAGLGQYLFADWRYASDGTQNDRFVLNKPEFGECRILLAGDNFGCGSSREHAPWALVDYGFRAVISTSFADIFRGNAVKNGLLPVKVSREAHQELCRLAESNPEAEVTVDLRKEQVRFAAGKSAPFEIDGFARTCLLNGVDELGYLLSFEKEMASYERSVAERT